MPADTPTTTKPANPQAGTLTLVLDFVPLLIFFLTYFVGKFLAGNLIGVLAATIAFMVSTVVAVILSFTLTKRVSPMLWVSAIIILFFGGLTLYFKDPRFIQMKPTIIYCFFSALLFGGLLLGKPLLKYVLQAAYDGLSERGWKLLSLNWALFFAFLAIFNEVARAYLSFDAWLTVKVWGVFGLSFIFAAANLPMLMKHGLTIGTEGAVEDIGETKPPEG